MDEEAHYTNSKQFTENNLLKWNFFLVQRKNCMWYAFLVKFCSAAPRIHIAHATNKFNYFKTKISTYFQSKNFFITFVERFSEKFFFLLPRDT